jgi:hypothetical protein
MELELTLRNGLQSIESRSHCIYSLWDPEQLYAANAPRFLIRRQAWTHTAGQL